MTNLISLANLPTVVLVASSRLILLPAGFVIGPLVLTKKEPSMQCTIKDMSTMLICSVKKLFFVLQPTGTRESA